MDYCAHYLGLGNKLVWQRAADWAGVRIRTRAAEPSGARRRPCRPSRAASEVRTLRYRGVDQELVFAAPHFGEVISLRQAPQQLRDTLRIVSPDAMEGGVTRAASDQLMEYARQRTTQLWPRASAAVDLPLSARIAFVAGLAGLILLVITSGLFARPVSDPGGGAHSDVPRRAAAGRRPSWDGARPLAPPLADNELPTYTVLIPLRDESQMGADAAAGHGVAELSLASARHQIRGRGAQPRNGGRGRSRARRSALPHGRRAARASRRPSPRRSTMRCPWCGGQFVVVYDAEDVPEPDQLRLAAARFRAEPDLVCLQAELVPENAHENFLTALFAGEVCGAVRPAAAGARPLGTAGAAGRHEQSLPHRRAARARRLGCVQRHRGCRSRRASRAARPACRHLQQHHL